MRASVWYLSGQSQICGPQFRPLVAKFNLLLLQIIKVHDAESIFTGMIVTDLSE